MKVFCSSLGPHESQRWARILAGLRQAGTITDYIRLGASPECEYQEDDFLYGKVKNYHFTGAANPLIEKLMPYLPVFIDMQSRLARKGDRRDKYLSWTYHEYLNYFHILIEYFAQVLTSKHIDLIILETAPHLGVDYVIYILAKALNIPVLFFRPLPFPNRFFYLNSIEDLGFFTWAIDDMSAPQIKIANTFAHDWFYMKSVAKKKPVIDHKALLHNAKLLVKFALQTLKTGFYSGLNENLNSLSMRLRLKLYKSDYKKYFKDMPDYNEPYVYFPLHLQPEQTTSSFGAEYCDQILAVEQLAAKLPADWKIYVKENPKQGFFMREAYFFQRLAGIDKVRLLPKTVSTVELTENAKFVATVTGTAAWESICGGKPALVFGYTWFETLPGIVKFSDSFTVEALLSYKIDQAELQDKFNALLRKTKPGVIASPYETLVENYTEAENDRTLIKSLTEILAQIKTEFHGKVGA
ncbi:MAG: hypothetical protein K0Q57_125 [Gammaproteobacteria bacterium]|jgi:hypothetical protein|nr:hypothetical protein [Gammaproteobacteria bacterium]